MRNPTQDDTKVFLKILFTAIIFITFFQLLTEFVEAIYLFGLLGTEIPNEIGLVVLFFSPALLLLVKKPLSTPTGLKFILSASLFCRGVEIFLPTRGRLIFSGIGFAAMLLFFTAVLANDTIFQSSKDKAKPIGAGLSLSVFALILTRAVNSGSDITSVGMYRLITWGLIVIGIVLTWRVLKVKDNPKAPRSHGQRRTVFLNSFGLANIIAILYFVMTAPNIISRWAESSNVVVQVVLLASWFLVSVWWLNRRALSPIFVFGIGIVFSIGLLFSILPQQVSFPSSVDSGYPLPAPPVEQWQLFPVMVMVLFSAGLLLAFVHYLSEIAEQRPSAGVTAGALALNGGYLLILVLSQVFTTVYDYIPVIGPAFRDKYWLVLFLPALFSFIPLLFNLKKTFQHSFMPLKARTLWSISAGMLALLSIYGLGWRAANPPVPDVEKNSLRVFTYNIQQGFDDQGERNFDGQLKLIREKAPDIIGLQECDTARIAGGNTDVVAYMADSLDMYSYYGPSSVTGTFGIALLSRYPIENAKTYFLFSEGEQVAVIEADITVGKEVFRVYVTHLGNGGPIFQMRQMLELMKGHDNLIAMGDFNFRPYEEQYAITTTEFFDSFLIAEEKTVPVLWGNSKPWEFEERIDHVFVSDGVKVSYLEYITQPESDHPALFVDITW